MKKKIVVIMAILFIHNTVYGSTLSDKLVKNIIANNKVIDIDDDTITAEKVGTEINNVFLYNSDCWNLAGAVYNSPSQKIYLTYKYDNVNSKNDEIEATVNRIATEALCLNKQYERAEFVYNYLLKYFDYSKEDNPTLYDLVSDKKGNCHAFAQLYQLIMRKLNIPCESVVSTSMNHQWNIIKIDGKWYNVDCSGADLLNSNRDCFFLKSDLFFSFLGYYNGISYNNEKAENINFD